MPRKNTPACIATPPESARMGHAHSPVTTWTLTKERNPALGQGAGINENAVWLFSQTGAIPKPVEHNGAIRWLKTEIEAGASK